MSQRYFGRPLAGTASPDLAMAMCIVLPTVAGVLLGNAIGNHGVDATTRAAVGLLVAPVVTALLFGAHDGWKLLQQIRVAEAAGSVAPPPGEPTPETRSLGERAGFALVLGGVFTGVSAMGGAAFCIVVGAGIAGRLCGPGIGRWLVRRYEQRLGRRYYRTVGEPEKVVWLGASGLE